MATIETVDIPAFEGTVCEVVQKKNGVTLYMQGSRERFGVYVPESIRTHAEAKSGTVFAAGDRVRVTCDAGKFGLSAKAIEKLPAQSVERKAA
jgi:hypothetical protein